ncbi:hypothetical protein SLA2020_096640 [Shorea laevis]
MEQTDGNQILRPTNLSLTARNSTMASFISILSFGDAIEQRTPTLVTATKLSKILTFVPRFLALECASSCTSRSSEGSKISITLSGSAVLANW